MKSILRLMLLFGLFVAATRCLAETPEETFTRSFLPRLQAAVPSHQFEYRAPLEITDNTSGSVLFLNRIFGYVSANPAEKNAAVADYLAQIARVIADGDRPTSKVDLRLAVRSAEYIRRSQEAMGPGAKVTFPVTLAGDLVVVPVIDTPTTVKYVGETELANLGLSEQEAREVATKNTRSTQRSMLEVAKVPPTNGIGVINEEYAASRLAFCSDWEAIRAAIGGNLVVMAPAFDTVIYGDGSTLIGVDALRTIGLQIAKKSQVPLSPTVLRLKGDHWEVAE